MKRSMKFLLILLAAALFLSPLALQAQGELSLESLAARISNLQDGHNRQEQSLSSLLDRIRKLEGEVRSLKAPTVTPGPDKTATASAAVTRVRMTATARAQRVKSTATIVSRATSRARATANTRPRATSTPRPQRCNLPDVPEPPRSRQLVNCEAWSVTYKLITLATGMPIDDRLPHVFREFYPLVVDSARNCRVGPGRLGDLIYAGSLEMERQGKMSQGTGIGYLLGAMAENAFADVVKDAGGCIEAITLVVIWAEK